MLARKGTLAMIQLLLTEQVDLEVLSLDSVGCG